MTSHTLRIATRKSPLAVWQADEVARLLRYHHPALQVELVRMTTQGDTLLTGPLAGAGGKGLFVKELEQGMLDGKADLAVHSMKDVPVALPAGFELPVIMERADPYDALISTHYTSIGELPPEARVGTSSLRRQCQLQANHPAFRIVTLRGNVNTRLAKLERREYDAIILATAGLKRLGLGHHITQRLGPAECLPAIGQGAIGIECRSDDAATQVLISPLNHAATYTRVITERAMNRRLNGGCQLPIAGYAELTDDNQLHLHGMIGYPDGRGIIRAQARGDPAQSEELGVRVAESLLQQGAADILASLGIEARPV